ncbi:hypothetical protein U1Q18_009115 [Sarracenia purpurea var. burkii]
MSFESFPISIGMYPAVALLGEARHDHCGARPCETTAEIALPCSGLGLGNMELFETKEMGLSI